MICENCGKNQATTHIVQTINGESLSMNICDACAVEVQFGNMLFSSFDLGLDNLFSNFIKNSNQKRRVNQMKVCEKCGSSFEQIVKKGKVGCGQCYSTYRSELNPSIEKLHGKVKHIGKISKSAGKGLQIKRQISKLKEELGKAVEVQNFEEAAKLRDEIIGLERQEKENE